MFNDLQADDISVKLKKLTLLAILLPGIIMALTSIGLFILGGIGPCNGLHDSSGYYNYSCNGICCQQPCNSLNNSCEEFPKAMIFAIAGILLFVGIATSGGLFLYKRWLQKQYDELTNQSITAEMRN